MSTVNIPHLPLWLRLRDEETLGALALSKTLLVPLLRQHLRDIPEPAQSRLAHQLGLMLAMLAYQSANHVWQHQGRPFRGETLNALSHALLAWHQPEAGEFALRQVESTWASLAAESHLPPEQVALVQEVLLFTEKLVQLTPVVAPQSGADALPWPHNLQRAFNVIVDEVESRRLPPLSWLTRWRACLAGFLR